MTVTVPPELAGPLAEEAARRGTTPESLALEGVRSVLPAAAENGGSNPPPTRRPAVAIPEPRDEWERRLLAIGIDCGVSLSDEDLSSEALYD